MMGACASEEPSVEPETTAIGDIAVIRLRDVYFTGFTLQEGTVKSVDSCFNRCGRDCKLFVMAKRPNGMYWCWTKSEPGPAIDTRAWGFRASYASSFVTFFKSPRDVVTPLFVPTETTPGACSPWASEIQFVGTSSDSYVDSPVDCHSQCAQYPGVIGTTYECANRIKTSFLCRCFTYIRGTRINRLAAAAKCEEPRRSSHL